jgi:enoyl-CoA hydratase/carnithine racemase
MSTNETTNREEGAVRLERNGAVATIILARQQALNALTWAMYEQMEAHLDALATDEAIRVVIMRGEGKAFAAGTDIAQFQGFTGEDGKVYEHKMETIIEKLHNFPWPVIAAIHGYAVGAGIILASACDLRYASPSSRFGAPIARTLGNALSLKNYQHLVEGFGAMRAKEMLFTARLLPAEEALQSGFLTAIVEEEHLLAHVNEIAQQITTLAPLTIWATKETHRRIYASESDVPFDDVLARIYASHDFAEGVQAYVEKRKPEWQGR